MVTAAESPEDQESRLQNGHDSRTNGHTLTKLYWKTQVPLRTRKIVFHFFGGRLTQRSVDLSTEWYAPAAHPTQNRQPWSQQWIPVLHLNFCWGHLPALLHLGESITYDLFCNFKYYCLNVF